MKKTFFTFVLLLIGISTFTKSQNLINGDFEQGPGAGWGIYSSNGAGLIGTADFFYSTSIEPTVYPRSGQYMGRLGGFGYAQNSISQTVTLPSTPNVYLHTYYQDRNSTTSECAGLWVGATIKVIVANQTLLETYLCYYNQVDDWTHIYFDLSVAAGQTIEIVFRADAANSVWSYIYLDDLGISSSITDVEDEESMPDDYVLSQNHPNPFNPSTTIKYDLPEASHVTLKIYNVMGELAAVLVDEEKPAGYHQVGFDASKLSSGIYFYRISAGSFKNVKKMILVK